MVKSIITALLLLAVSLTVCAQSFQGAWKGDLKLGTTSLAFVIHLAEENGNWKASADSPDQGAFQIPATVKIINNAIEVAIEGGISYIGVLEQQDLIGGEFQQGQFKAKLDLKRDSSSSSSTKNIRTQRVVPPYSYDTLDVTFTNTKDQVQLSGTISSPRAKGKFPAVILVSGSGPQDRNEHIMGHDFFHVLADYLTQNNIIVLRYDDRGVAKSTGNFMQSTIENFSQDALSALNYLKQQKHVDPNKIGIIGHSEGGLIAQLLAGQHVPNLGFIVSLAGPSMPIDSLMVSQLYHVGKVAGMSDFALTYAQNINTRNFEIVKSNSSHEEAMALILKNMRIDPKTLTANSRLELETLLLPSYRYFMRIDPTPFIRQIKIPMYAAFGSLDIQVPAAPNMLSLKKNLPYHAKSVNKEFSGLNHLFQKAKTGAIAEYPKINETINPALLTDLAQWINGL